MIRNALPIFLTIISLAGCTTLAPKYTRPEAPIPANWPSGPAYKGAADGRTDPASADIGWREFYVDEQLQKVIGLALDNNRDLRVAALNTEPILMTSFPFMLGVAPLALSTPPLSSCDAPGTAGMRRSR